MHHGRESEKGSQRNREDALRYIYHLCRSIPAGWADGSDEIIKHSGFISAAVRIWGDNLCA